MIPIPTGMKYRSKAWGSAIKEIKCVHCGAEFVYEMRRVVEAQTSAPLFIGMADAQQRAADQARARLADELKNHDDDVPCPRCQRLQPAMNRDYRSLWTVFIVIAWIFSLIAAFFGYEMDEAKFREASTWVKWLPVISTFSAIVGIVWCRVTEFRGRSTDRAQLKAEAQAEGFARLGLPRVVGDGWIWVRVTLFQSPRVCAGCGAPNAKEVFHRPLGEAALDVHVCESCQGRAMTRRFYFRLGVMIVPILAVAIAFPRTPGDGVTDNLAILIAGGTIGCVLLVPVNKWLLGRWGMPLCYRKYRRWRDEVEVKFRSAAAAEEFVAHIIEEMRARQRLAGITSPSQEGAERGRS